MKIRRRWKASKEGYPRKEQLTEALLLNMLMLKNEI
jgi:hypothetical protein